MTARERSLLIKIVANVDDLCAAIEADPVAKTWFVSPSSPHRKPILRTVESLRQNLDALVRMGKEVVE